MLDYMNLFSILCLAGAAAWYLTIKPAVALGVGEDEHKNVGFRILSLTLCAVLVFCAGALAQNTARQRSRDRALETIRERFDVIGYLKDPKDMDGGRRRVVIGKVLPIDVTAKAVDVLFLDLPKELRPDSPDDVGTIAWVDRRKEATGVRRTRSGAVTRDMVRITLIDRKQGRLLGESDEDNESRAVQFILRSRQEEPRYKLRGR